MGKGKLMEGNRNLFTCLPNNQSGIRRKNTIHPTLIYDTSGVLTLNFTKNLSGCFERKPFFLNIAPRTI